MARFTIGTLAAAAGVKRDTVRYYERTGLLPAPDRSASGYRLYGDIELERIRFIRTAQHLGFTLAEISTLLALRASESARAADVLCVTESKIAEAKGRIVQLEAIQTALQQLADACPVDAPVTDCPILAYLAKGHPV